MQAPSGAMSFNCFHDSCSGKGWQEVKVAIGEPDGDHYDPPKKTSGPARSPNLTGGSMTAAAKDHTNPDPFTWLRSYGIDIVKAVRIGGKRGDLDVILAGGETVQLGTTSNLLSPRDCQIAFADALGVILPNLKRDDWRPFAYAILNAAELEDVGSDPQAELKAWIEAQIDTFARLPAGDTSELVNSLRENGVAREQDGTVYINLVKFMANLNPVCGARAERGDLLKRLNRAHFTTKQPGYRVGDETVKVRAWQSPPHYLDDD